MNRIIIYGSKYGTALEYAEEISKRSGVPAIPYKEMKDINQYREIIYIGGLYAGGVCGMAKTLRKWSVIAESKLCIVTVGLSNPQNEQNMTNIRNAIKMQLPEKLYSMAEIFHLRGGINYSKLSVSYKVMMGMLYNKAKNTPTEQQDEETKAIIETYNQKVSFVDLKTIEPIMDYLRQEWK